MGKLGEGLWQFFVLTCTFSVSVKQFQNQKLKNVNINQLGKKSHCGLAVHQCRSSQKAAAELCVGQSSPLLEGEVTTSCEEQVWGLRRFNWKKKKPRGQGGAWLLSSVSKGHLGQRKHTCSRETNFCSVWGRAFYQLAKKVDWTISGVPCHRICSDRDWTTNSQGCHRFHDSHQCPKTAKVLLMKSLWFSVIFRYWEFEHFWKKRHPVLDRGEHSLLFTWGMNHLALTWAISIYILLGTLGNSFVPQKWAVKATVKAKILLF